MTRRRKIEASKVIEAVESGRLSKDVMDSYGLEKPAPPNSNASRRRGKGSVANDLGPPLGDVTISKRGSLVLPKSMVEELGLGLEETFIARKTKVGIILKPM